MVWEEQCLALRLWRWEGEMEIENQPGTVCLLQSSMTAGEISPADFQWKHWLLSVVVDLATLPPGLCVAGSPNGQGVLSAGVFGLNAP